MEPRYPEIHVSLKSRNRYALVSAVRQGLRRAGRPHDEIDRFSREALTAAEDDPRRVEEVCHRWVALGPSAGA
jgi:hypothetical protein